MQTTIEFRSRQKELWGVMCFHNYFRDSICRELEFVPTPETATLMRNLYLILKPLDFGFVILQQDEKSAELFRTLPPKTKLTFFIRVKNIRFSHFSQIPFKQLDEVFYYSNLGDETVELPEVENSEVFYYFRNLKVGDIEKKMLHLSQHSKVKIKPKKFFLNIGSEDAFKETTETSYSELKLSDPFGEDSYNEKTPYKVPTEVLFYSEILHRIDLQSKALERQGVSEEDIRKQVPKMKEDLIKMLDERKGDSVAVDLRHVPPGKYTVEINDGKKEDYYLSEMASERNFGVLDLYLTGPGNPPENCLIEEALSQEEGAGLCHVINFEARTTYWRYLFLNYNGSNVEAVEVRDEEGKVDFSKPRADVLEYIGKPTLIVESQVPIQLQQIPKQEFWLKRSKGKRNIKDIKLPTATAESIRPLKQDDKTYKVISDIYVYL